MSQLPFPLSRVRVAERMGGALLKEEPGRERRREEEQEGAPGHEALRKGLPTPTDTDMPRGVQSFRPDPNCTGGHSFLPQFLLYMHLGTSLPAVYLGQSPSSDFGEGR